MTESPKYPKGRPPKSKNVLLKSTMEPIKEDSPVAPIIPVEEKPEVKIDPIVKVDPEVKDKPVEVKEKKPRTEQQILATKKMIEANKAKRKINIIESAPVKKDDPPTPTPTPKTEPKEDSAIFNKLKQMEDIISQLSQKKKKTKQKIEPAPKPVKEEKPKPKKMQPVESSESESSSESDSESDDDKYVEKYKQKAERRFQAVQSIEQRLQQAKAKPRGKYDHLTLF